MDLALRRLGVLLFTFLLLSAGNARAANSGAGYYPDGKLQWEYLYQNGQVREAKWYDPQGRMTARTLFADGRQSLSEGYRADGSLEWQLRELGDDRQEVTRFGAGRRPEVRYQVAAGKVDGPSTLFYPNGQPRQMVTFRAGIPHGPARIWYDTGLVESEYAYRDGQLDGPCRSFFTDGRPAPESRCENDTR